MKKAILGTKVGMSQIFTPEGTVIPVSVISTDPCVVVQIKTVEKDGYNAIKVAYGDIKEAKLNKPDLGQFKKSKLDAKRHMKEFRLDDISQYKVGDEIKCTVFKQGDFVDVSGVSKGKGFAGPIKRWNFHLGPAAHGSGYHRGVGSLSGSATPGRVFKNTKMAGQMGAKNVTVQNLEIVKVDENKNVILVAGGIPGPKKGLVVIKDSVKKAPGKSRWFANK
ncbi:MAG TPA: 50S ribosomal protein L3 [Clostridiales bacterium]|nr:50S ribosomal protein L3 [Clostridiales bacterium]